MHANREGVVKRGDGRWVYPTLKGTVSTALFLILRLRGPSWIIMRHAFPMGLFCMYVTSRRARDNIFEVFFNSVKQQRGVAYGVIWNLSTFLCALLSKFHYRILQTMTEFSCSELHYIEIRPITFIEKRWLDLLTTQVHIYRVLLCLFNLARFITLQHS